MTFYVPKKDCVRIEDNKDEHLTAIEDMHRFYKGN